jgi:hypothetical protein
MGAGRLLRLHDLELHTHASAEAQVAALADDVAYNHHDLHDGLRAELFSTDELAELPILDGCFAEVDRLYPGLNYYRRRHEALRRFFGFWSRMCWPRARRGWPSSARSPRRTSARRGGRWSGFPMRSSPISR